MPKLADHEQRKDQITSAARRVIARGGLAAATFQSVAAEAGISVRLVQYYFGTKREFLLATHRTVMTAAGARFMDKLSTLGADAAPRDILRAIFTEVLPLDETRWEETIVLGAFHHAAITGSEITAEDTLAAPRSIVDVVAAQLRRHRGAETPHAARTLDLDAQLIAAAVGGIAQGILVDAYPAANADELLDRLFDRLLDT